MEQIARLFQETYLLLAVIVRAAVRSIRDNGGLFVLSIVLAFGLWIFVTDAENPTQTRVLPVDVPVQPVNLPADVAVAEEIAPIRVRVKIAEDVFDSLTAADFEATVDLEGLTVGEYELPVEVRALTSRGGLRVDEVLPERVNVRLAQLTNKSVPVVIDVQGVPPAGYTMSTPEPEDATVFVSGPQGQVDLVSQASAVIDVEARTEDVDQAVRLVARDNRGVLIQGVALDPDITEVHITIEQSKFSRSMAVSPETSGEPADGYNVIAVSVNPAAVTVRGEEAFIEGTVAVKTKPIDIAGVTDDVVRTVSLDLPAGAEVTGGVPVVTVTIKIEPAQGVLSFDVPVSASNLGDGLAIQGALPSVRVQLRGERPTLLALTPNDILVSVNLSDLGAGTHRVAVGVSPPDETTVQQVAPPDVEIVLGQP